MSMFQMQNSLLAIFDNAEQTLPPKHIRILWIFESSPLGPPFPSLTTLDRILQERVPKEEHRARRLIALDPLDSPPVPNGGDFGDEVPPLTLGLRRRRQILKVPPGVFRRQVQRNELIHESGPVVRGAELGQAVQFGLQRLRGGSKATDVRVTVGGTLDRSGVADEGAPGPASDAIELAASSFNAESSGISAEDLDFFLFGRLLF
eukprot:CAMPEP_0197468760 /NCGR_PEP_ID=MMETSP1175-20131217/66254_1 /TAXON_ID=1003142 /ORGANISM="Triceratium dubium, Strain CCMP147" /LENGTH=204 /DNA_ID=CAMNT_0043004877 /DNA_START=241 /DNA_END=854 /DNA_ORIENTATION=+